MHHFTGTKLLAAVLVGLSFSAPVAADILGTLKNQAEQTLEQRIGGHNTGQQGGLYLPLPALGGQASSNMAGVLEYCLKNNYVKHTDATHVKNQLLSKLGVNSAARQHQDTNFQKGLSGLLLGNDGTTFDINKIQGELKEKACNYVLDNVKKLL